MARFVNPNRILAFVPNWLGDVAMCTPALRALHHRFPEAALTAAGRASACALLNGLPWISNCQTLPAQPGLKEMLRIRAECGRPDLAVIFPHSFRSALMARLVGARRRVGYARNGRSFLLTDAVPPYQENGRTTPIYMTREYLELLKPFGCEDDREGLELRANPEILALMESRLGDMRPRVGIAPGAAFGPSKRWPAERYAAVADALVERIGARCVLLTGPGEEDTREAVLRTAKTPLVQCDEGHPTIDTLKATIAALDLLVCNDSGPRHVAVAFKVPTVCIMGSTSPKYSEGPYEHGNVLRVDVDCGPCQKPVCETDHRCMTRIGSDWVTDTACEILGAKRRAD